MMWLHYVGGHYTPTNFVREARRFGVSRRAPANIARSMNFGDVVALLYDSHNPVCFAEFVITDIILDHQVAGQVSEKLIKQGHKVEPTGGGSTTVVRECGSFELGGGSSTDASIKEIMDAAIEIQSNAGGGPTFVMIAGHLINVYKPPRVVTPNPPFTRSFIKSDSMDVAGYPSSAGDIEPGQIRPVRGYAKRSRRERQAVLNKASAELFPSPIPTQGVIP